MPILFALVGATGVGKTKLSIALAKEFHAQIISMDSRQVYKGFCIGTAQPSKESLEEVPHHLVDFLPPQEKFSVGEFVRNVKALLQKDSTPYILVGGTGMYLQALSEGLAQIPDVAEEVRIECERFLLKNGVDALYQRVLELDPASANAVERQDKQRLLRALEVFEQTGKRFSEVRNSRVGGIGHIKTFVLNRLRTTLYENIDSRVMEMVNAGWKDEVACLYETVPQTAPAWQSLGYKEWVSAIRGEMNEEEVVERVRQGTRRYAKRQLTWFRHQVEGERVELGPEFFRDFERVAFLAVAASGDV